METNILITDFSSIFLSDLYDFILEKLSNGVIIDQINVITFKCIKYCW